MTRNLQSPLMRYINVMENAAVIGGSQLVYDMTNGHLSLLDENGNVMSYVDLPTELLVVSGRYNSTTKNIELVLANGDIIYVPVGDLVNEILEVTDIRALTTAQCEGLKAGGVVVKKTGNSRHTYIVSYKEAGVGLCMTYTDADNVETVSYDYVGGAWVYNSTDYTKVSGKQDELNTTSVSSGTLNEVIGFDSQGNLVRGAAGRVDQTYDPTSTNAQSGAAVASAIAAAITTALNTNV